MARRKRKKRRLKIGRIIFCFIIVFIIIQTLIFKNDIITYYHSFRLGYDKDTISLFKEQNIFNYVKDEKYSKTVETAIKSDEFNSNYLKYYYNIDYVDDEYFIKNINALLKNGYSDTEINTIYKKLDNNSINTVTKYKYNKDLTNYLSLKYFNIDYLQRYLEFNNNTNKLDFSPYIDKVDDNSLNYEDIITYVNASLDIEYYTKYTNVVDGNNTFVLVNKYNKLASDFVPDNLENISSNCAYGTQKLVTIAKNAFEEMCNYMHTINLYPYATSTYRSYSNQNYLYNSYVNRDGKKEADTYSARPGFSEHQTGLAVDVGSNSYSIFASSNEYKWMVDNAHKYGFILRYPEGKEYLTGYMFESWHYRYIGIEAATYIYENKITFDEYIARKIGN